MPQDDLGFGDIKENMHFTKERDKHFTFAVTLVKYSFTIKHGAITNICVIKIVAMSQYASNKCE